MEMVAAPEAVTTTVAEVTTTEALPLTNPERIEVKD
jgi:hypothetical protein